MKNYRSILVGLIFIGLQALLIAIPTSCQKKKKSKGSDQTINSADSVPNSVGFVEEFTAGVIEAGNARVNTDFGLVEHSFTMTIGKKSEEVTFQKDRKITEDTFRQGKEGENTQETFQLNQPGMIDILFVIDDSTSMIGYQKKLADSFASVIPSYGGVDWRLSVMTTTSSCLRSTRSGRKHLSIDDYTTDPVATLSQVKELIEVGDFGDPTERGVLALTHAIEQKACDTESNVWQRPGANHSILLVTDEENCGSASNEGCAGEPHSTADFFLSKVTSKTRVSGLFLLADNPKCPNSGGYFDAPNPQQYLEIVRKTNGIQGEICQDNYNSTLATLVNSPAVIPIRQFNLRFPPVLSTLSFLVDGKVAAVEAEVSGNSLVIKNELPQTANVLEVAYSHSPSTLENSFALSKIPDPGSIRIRVNEKTLGSDKFFYKSDSNSVEFDSIAESLADIKVTYRNSEKLSNQFNVKSTIIPSSLEIFVEEVLQENYVFDVDKGIVSLEKTPLDGEKISFRYHVPGDINNSFLLQQLDPATIEGIIATDMKTGRDIEFRLDGNLIVFPPDEVENQRQVKLEIDTLYSGDDLVFRAQLEGPRVGDRPTILADGLPGICDQNVSFTNSVLEFSCLHDDVSKIEISYNFVKGYTNRFPLNPTFGAEKGILVYIDDKIVEDYVQDTIFLVVNEDILRPGASVKIEYFK